MIGIIKCKTPEKVLHNSRGSVISVLANLVSLIDRETNFVVHVLSRGPLKVKSKLTKLSKKTAMAYELPFRDRVGFGQRDALYWHIFHHGWYGDHGESPLWGSGTQLHGTTECNDCPDDRWPGSILSMRPDQRLGLRDSDALFYKCLYKTPQTDSLRPSPLEHPDHKNQVYE